MTLEEAQIFWLEQDGRYKKALAEAKEMQIKEKLEFTEKEEIGREVAMPNLRPTSKEEVYSDLPWDDNYRDITSKTIGVKKPTKGSDLPW